MNRNILEVNIQDTTITHNGHNDELYNQKLFGVFEENRDKQPKSVRYKNLHLKNGVFKADAEIIWEEVKTHETN